MNLLKNKKGQEASGTGMPMSLVVGFAILIVFTIFVLFWYYGLGNKIIELFRLFF